jgi:hypothetical protein
MPITAMTSKLFIATIVLLALFSCKREVTYIDLSTGEQVKLAQDSSGAWVNAETGRPVRLYVNTTTRDTIYGPTGTVVNNKVVRTSGGKYYYTDDEEWKAINAPKPAPATVSIPSGVEKIKVEKDGDVKIKTKHGKIKIDGETGERKVKRD